MINSAHCETAINLKQEKYERITIEMSESVEKML